MENHIEFCVKDTTYRIPNAWKTLSSYQFSGLIRDILRMAAGKISVGVVKVNHVCRVMDWNLSKIKDEQAYQNLAWLAEQVTFPFIIVYPHNDEALDGLDPATRKLCKRIPPHQLTGVTIAKYLSRLDYKYAIDSCFCKQMRSGVTIGDEVYTSYKIDTAFGHLTCSLTALQFIEARNLINGPFNQLPLLAAILYYPDRYSSDGAHQLAGTFKLLPDEILQEIAFNFQAFVNFLFTRTEFKLLTEPKNTKVSAISTGALESLYNLSSDGYGNIDTVEHLNIIQYLAILRKKLIDTVRSLDAAKLNKAKIAEETGLSITTINNIL